VKLDRPDWLRRLYEWRAKKRDDIQTAVFGTVVYTLLASICVAISQAHPLLIWLLAPALFSIAMAMFGVLTFTIFIYQITIADLAYYTVEIGYRSVELLLTLLEEVFGTLSSVGASRLFTLPDMETLETPSLLYILISSGIVTGWVTRRAAAGRTKDGVTRRWSVAT